MAGADPNRCHLEEVSMHPSTDVVRLEQLVTIMSERLAALTRTLGT